MTSRIKALMSVAVLCAVGTPTATRAQDGVAQDASSGWRAAQVRYVPTDGAPSTFQVVYTTDESRPGAAFHCDQDRLRVRVALEGGDLRATLSDVFPRARQSPVTLLIEGEEQGRDEWIYLPEHKIIVAPSRAPSAKVFNAVVKGEAVAVRHRQEIVPVALAPIDDAFRGFVDRCKAAGAI